MKKILSILMAFFISALIFIVPYKAYATEAQWVLVEVIDGSNDEKWAEQNTSAAYRYYPSYSRGSYSVKTEYIGKTDNYYDPPYIHGESLTVHTNWTTPPQTIKKDQIISLNVSLFATDNSQSAFKFSGSTSAWLDNSRIATKDGKNHFEINFGNKYATQNATVTSVLGQGSEGQQKVIELNFYSSNTLYTQYVYEWSSTKTPIDANPAVPVKKPLPAPEPEKDPKYKDSGIRVSDLYGEVVIRRGDNEDGWELLELGDVIYEGDHIKTEYESGAILSMPDMTTFHMKGESEIIMTVPSGEDSKLKLVAGNIYANVKKMLTHGIMEIEMSQAVAGIKGTTFVLEETGSQSTLKVLEGTVEFKSRKSGKTLAVAAGNMAVADASGNVRKSALNIATEAGKWDKTIIELQIDNKNMKVNGVSKEIDPGRDTVPTVINGRTLIPIRAVFEALGGTVGYDEAKGQKIALKKGGKTLEMWIGKTELNIEGAGKKMDVAPMLLNGRTMVPVRFVAENFGYSVQWKEAEKKIIIQ